MKKFIILGLMAPIAIKAAVDVDRFFECEKISQDAQYGTALAKCYIYDTNCNRIGHFYTGNEFLLPKIAHKNSGKLKLCRKGESIIVPGESTVYINAKLPAKDCSDARQYAFKYGNFDWRTFENIKDT